MLSVLEAKSQILKHFQPLPLEEVSLLHACGRILGEDIAAGFDLPPFENSSVDGFALSSSDRPAETNTKVRLRVSADIPAGVMPPITLQPGTAARIMTGAPVPSGADCIVPVEQTDFPYRDPSSKVPEYITVIRFPKKGDNIRPRGQDVRAGEILLRKGQVLRPQDTGLISSLGRAKVQVHRRARIALFSSGDELTFPGSPLQPGKIYDANSFSLAHLAVQAGAEVVALGIAPDNEDEIKRKFLQAANEQVDFILTSAGVSVGAFDYVRKILEHSGSLELWRVNMRPGKPLAFGTFKDIPVISLPGNPVSAFIGFLVFVLPVIKRLSGANDVAPMELKVKLEEPVDSDGRESYLRAIVTQSESGYSARLTGHQGSGNLYSLVQANALLIVPAGVKSVPAGSELKAWLLQG